MTFPSLPDGYRAWMDRALCRTDYVDPEWWFSDDFSARTRALANCSVCEVKAECLDLAISSPEISAGIWGGLSINEIRNLRKRKSK